MSFRLRCPRRLGGHVAVGVLCCVVSWAGVAQAQSILTRPEVISAPPPRYPAAEAASKTVGRVIVEALVSETGRVQTATIRESLSVVFDAAALEAVRNWEFNPATVDGKAVAARVLVEVPFAPVRDGEPRELPLTSEPAGSATSELPEVPSDVATPIGPPAATENDAPAAALAPEARIPGNAGGSEIVVRGRAQKPARGASDHRIRVGELRRVPRHDASDMLELAPGVVLTGEGGPGRASQLFIRGFDARLGQDVEFSVEGVPINQVGNLNGNGYADLSFIIPEVVREVRVLEGPFEPRQGNFAVAGSVDYDLALERRGLVVQGSWGSFNTRRLLLQWGPASGNAETFGAAAVSDSDGFGQNRAYQHAQAVGQYAGSLGAGGQYRLTALASASTAGDAGVLRADDLDSGRIGFFDTYDSWQGGDAERFMVSASLDQRTATTEYGTTVFAARLGSRTRENFTGYLLDVQEAIQEPHGQRGDRIERSYDGMMVGTRGYGRLAEIWRGLRQELELGYLARGDFLGAEQYRAQASNDIPYARDVDLDSRVANLGIYADLGLRPLRWLTLRGGLRVDSYFYDLVDRCASTTVRFVGENTDGDASCFSQQPEGDYREPSQGVGAQGMAFLPRSAVLFGPFDNFLFSVAYGRGARAIDPVFVNADTATPVAELSAYEGGVQWAKSLESSTMILRSVFFRTEVEQDLIFSQTEGRNTLADGTSRTGWSGSMRWTGTWFDTNDTLTVVRATFDDTGLLIPYVPPLVLRSDSAVHSDLPWKIGSRPLHGALALGCSVISPRPLQYDEWSEEIFTLDTAASLEFSPFEFELSVENLLDRRYRIAEYNYASDFGSQAAPTLVPSRHFAAGAPRTFMLTLAMTLGGEG